MVRSDKSDPAPNPQLWETLETLADVRPTAIAAPLTERRHRDAFDRNVRLEKPRFSLRSALGLLGAVSVGVMIGRAVP